MHLSVPMCSVILLSVIGTACNDEVPFRQPDATAATDTLPGNGADSLAADDGLAGLEETFDDATVAGCPLPIIDVAEGDVVLPGTVLNLSGTQSTSPYGNIAVWEWSVVQPVGADGVFLPTATSATVRFEVNVVGEYVFGLKVRDDDGNESCTDVTYRVLVTSEEAIRIEVLWNTPGDLDPSDSVGSDINLHYLHPAAGGDWFHSRYACNWLNHNPEWGGSGAYDNPRLAQDDTDGTGPEIVTHLQPEFGKVYRVGVHYFDDAGFGESFVSIRIFMDQDLRFEWTDVRLQPDEIWDVATITWPSQAVTPVRTASDGPVITVIAYP